MLKLGATSLGKPPLRNHLPSIEVLSRDQLMAVHEASLALLQEIGIEFMGLAGRQAFRKAGASVHEATGLARIPRNWSPRR